MTDQAEFWHEKLHVYQHTLSFVSRAEALIAESTNAPAVLDHLERASESIAEQIVNGNTQWSAAAKCRYFDIARGSALECAACMDICRLKGLISVGRCNEEKRQLRMIVGMLAGLIRAQHREVCESCEADEVATGEQGVEFHFDHERLEVYQLALGFVGWVDVAIRQTKVGGRRRTKLDALATSIVLNIAEGNGRSDAADHRSFLEIAHRSAVRAALQLDLVNVKTALPLATLDEGKQKLRSIVRMLLGMRGYFEETDHAQRGDSTSSKNGIRSGIRSGIKNGATDRASQEGAP